MYTFSVDIGIDNFAYCLFNGAGILDWDNVSLTSPTPKSNILMDVSLNVCSMCNGKGNHTYNETYFCLKHARTHVADDTNKCINILPKELILSKLSKKIIANIKQILKAYNIPVDNKLKKDQLLETLVAHIKTSYMCPVIRQTLQQQKKANGCSSDIVSICRNLTILLDSITNQFPNIITHVIVENQMRAKMKMVQSMVLQYFMVKDSSIVFKCISASNKLKLSESIEYINQSKLNNTYKNRKNIGVDVCNNILTSSDIYIQWMNHLSKYHDKKQDDLTDSFLQGLWYIRKTSDS